MVINPSSLRDTGADKGRRDEREKGKEGIQGNKKKRNETEKKNGKGM